MLARIHRAMKEKDEGFTLIELLVVIIIIGILAAIAIPVFLNQRKKGYDSAAKSDLRNAAAAQESYLTDNTAYAPDTASMTDFKSSPNVTTTVVSRRGASFSDSFCLSSKHGSSSNTWYWDSATGGLTAPAAGGGSTPCT